MIKNNTSRLYFGQFPYKICLSRSGPVNYRMWKSGWNPVNCLKLLKRKKSSFRVYTRIRWQKRKSQIVYKMYLFLSSKLDYDIFVKKYSKYIESITEPYSDHHVDLLKENTHVILRENLIYKKYRYVVNFRRAWHQSIDDIDKWVNDNFYKNIGCGDIKWHPYGYNPRIYLKNQEDLVLIKLTWGDRIRQITWVQLLNELTV